MNKDKQKPLRIFYFSGPGTPIEVYQTWEKGEIYTKSISITYSGQFYEVCKELNCQAYVVGMGEKEQEIISNEQFTVQHLPKPKIFNKNTGIIFYLNQIVYDLILIIKALQFRANVFSGNPYRSIPWISYILKLFKVKVIPLDGCVLMPKFQKTKQTKKEKFMIKLLKQAYQKSIYCCLYHSDDIRQQIEEITEGQSRPLFRYISKYPREPFEKIKAPDFNLPTFNVLFIGRIETNKGVFLLLEIAKQFAAECKHNIRFELCGSGNELENLKESVKKAQLESSFICHGFSNREQLVEILGQSHIVIVPTLSSFIEGFNKVVLEAVLAGRPVITSQVCPAISDVQEAVLEAEIDSLESYKDCILKLHNDRDLYEQKRNAALSLREKFFDSPEIFQKQLKKILVNIQNELND